MTAEQGETESTESCTITAAENSGIENLVSDKQTRAADETECMDANHPTISQLEHHEEVYTSKSSSDENNSSCSDDRALSSTASEVSTSEYCPTPVKRAKVSPVGLGKCAKQYNRMIFTSSKRHIFLLHSKLCGEACSCYH